MFVRSLTLLFVAALWMPAIHSAPEVRIKDLARVEGVRGNPLIGYGLVVGLQGTGDGTQASFTIQSLANVLRRSGISVPAGSLRVKNVAAVMVTAELPPFARASQRLDVTVSSIGDAKSLRGGTLLMTPLSGPDGQVYAVAQGQISLGGGFTAGGGGSSVVNNHPTVGTIPMGAMIEHRVMLTLDSFQVVRLLINRPDFNTAHRVAEEINATFGPGTATAEDPATVRVDPPSGYADDLVGLISRLESIRVRPDAAARVVVNERTGTVVMGNQVRISTVALAHGSLTIEVDTTLDVSQPAPLSDGETTIVPRTDIYVEEGPNRVIALEEGITVAELVQALNELGVSAGDMVAIFQAMSAAGALHAELVLL